MLGVHMKPLGSRKDGEHFWGGQKQCMRAGYVLEIDGRNLAHELEEIANFAALTLGCFLDVFGCDVLSGWSPGRSKWWEQKNRCDIQVADHLNIFTAFGIPPAL